MNEKNVVEVGPVLIAHAKSGPMIKAIKKLNKNVRIIERNSYVRILVPVECFVTRQALEEEVGNPVLWPEYLEKIMPSFKGRLKITEEQVTWSLERER